MRIEGRPGGVIALPSSKSLSHRALLCAALAGDSEVRRLLLSQDTEATLRAVRALGADVTVEEDTLRAGRPANGRGAETIDCGESGSTLRFCIPLCAVFREKTTFVGHGRLMERPLTPYEQALGAAGMTFRRAGDCLTVNGRLQAGTYTLPGDVSSQFVSGLLFALPLLEGDSEIHLTDPLQSRDYVELTRQTMRQFGVVTAFAGEDRLQIPGGQRYTPAKVSVEGDFSGGAFFLVAGALGFPVECVGLSEQSPQGDRAIVDILRAAGATVETGPHGGLIARADRLRGITVDVSQIPDLVPPLAALCCFCEGESRIVGASRLRLKESDRLRSVATELKRLGADVTEYPDALHFRGVPRLHGGDCHAWNDHRIAMMAAIASLRADGAVTVDDPDCVKKSYPAFWRDFAGGAGNE